MKIIAEHDIPANTGWAGDLNQGQVLRITATTIVDFVAFTRDDLTRRFDQARTKVYNMKIFVGAGDKLVNKYNERIMTFLADGFTEGTHDLQEGMCSGPRYQLAKDEGRVKEYGRGEVEIPDHGCWENLSRALEPYGIAPQDIPSPFNLFQNMDIDGTTGIMKHTNIRPRAPASIELRAEIDLVVAASACPDMAAPQGGQPIRLMIYEA